MIAIIPVAGIGSRLRPHTHTQPKALVPVAGKPILAHIIDNLFSSGISEYIFIVGYLGDKVEEYVKSNYPSINKKFILQDPREGIGHAGLEVTNMLEFVYQFVAAVSVTEPRTFQVTPPFVEISTRPPSPNCPGSVSYQCQNLNSGI